MNIYESEQARWEWHDRKEAEKLLKGEFVWSDENWFCSKCGFHREGRFAVNDFKYCPNCGRRMNR